MTKNITSTRKAGRAQTSTKPKDDNNPSSAEVKKKLKEFRSKVEKLSYENALKELDLILLSLQNETLPVEDLQKFYLKGQVYLEHCERLLNNVEQEIVQLSPEKLEKSISI